MCQWDGSLICGDVGFGKTELAIRASYKAVLDNKQVAVFGTHNNIGLTTL